MILQNESFQEVFILKWAQTEITFLVDYFFLVF